MTWSIQLTSWALPPLLAVLLSMRDTAFLWPRRREPAAPALFFLTVAAGAWALLHLVSVVTPSLSAKVVLERAQYVPSAAAPVLWAWFALAYAHPPRRRLWALVVVGALSLATVVFALTEPSVSWLFRNAVLAPLGSGAVTGLLVHRGSWHWVYLGVRVVIIAWATALVAGRAVRTPGGHRGAGWAVAAGLLALIPAAAHVSSGGGAAWADLSSVGFAVAATTMSAGLLRPRLQGLGPVARTLVMVEIRDPIVVLDGRGRIVDVNHAAEDLLGLRPYGDVPLELGKLWARARGEPEVTATMSLPVQGQAGTRPFDVTVTPLATQRGQDHSAMVLRDVTTRTRMEQQLERMAKSDPLTGLANRRHFMDSLEREVERADRYGRELSLVLLDLDHFKKVNDTWGHAAGDDVLKDAARAMRSVCRDIDLPARVGGEELALLLPETNAEGARVVAERLRERIENVRHPGSEGRTFQVTASMGVSTYGEGAATGTALLQMADEALYSAKDAGRNRVVLAPRP